MSMITQFRCTAMPMLNIIITLVVMLYPDSSAGISADNDLFTLNVTMKNYQSTKEDQIVFVQHKLDDEELTIVGYTPLVSMTTAHHMNMVACENPASQEPFWTDGVTCGAGEQMLLYGWDRDALPFRFPEEVGILVGKNTPYKYVVVNIHYLPIVKNDYSGNQLIFSRKRQKYLAGVVSGGADSIHLPPKTLGIKTPFSCQYDGPKIYIFAAGVHAHRWARVNSLYRIRDGNTTLILKGDPQQIHQSYLLPSPIEVVDGDYIVGQCVYDNTEDRVIKVGLSYNDEMCNVMAGYWYERNYDKENDGKVPLKACWGNQIPHLSVLIPPDSEIPPQKSSDLNRISMGKHAEGEHAMTILTKLTTRGKIVYISLIAAVCFVVVIVGCLIRMKTPRGICGLDCLNAVADNKARARSSERSIFRHWLKRRDGFDRLEQSSDGENELANNEVSLL